MEYKTRQWHEKCFSCCVCKNPIGTKSFIPREQEIYCAGCYEEKYATRCIKCNKVSDFSFVCQDKNKQIFFWHLMYFLSRLLNFFCSNEEFAQIHDSFTAVILIITIQCPSYSILFL